MKSAINSKKHKNKSFCSETLRMAQLLAVKASALHSFSPSCVTVGHCSAAPVAAHLLPLRSPAKVITVGKTESSERLTEKSLCHSTNAVLRVSSLVRADPYSVGTALSPQEGQHVSTHPTDVPGAGETWGAGSGGAEGGGVQSKGPGERTVPMCALGGPRALGWSVG